MVELLPRLLMVVLEGGVQSLLNKTKIFISEPLLLPSPTAADSDPAVP